MTRESPYTTKDPYATAFLKRLVSSSESVAALPPGLSEFRVSSMPYCPVLDFLTVIDPNTPHGLQNIESGDEPSVVADFSSDFYFSLGHGVHKVLQDWASRNPTLRGLVYGNWACVLSNCPQAKFNQLGERIHHRLSMQYYPTDRCAGCTNKECGVLPRQWEYVEISFSFGDPVLSGHMDLLSFNPITSRFRGWEAKSTNSQLWRRNSTEAFFPSPAHIIQIEDYCTLLHLIYGIDVEAYTIVYLGRERAGMVKSFTRTFELPMRDVRQKQLEQAVKGRKAVVALLKSGKVTEARQWAEKVLATKPCVTRSEYSSYMHAAFFGTDACVYHASGACYRHAEMLKKLGAAWSGAKDGTD